MTTLDKQSPWQSIRSRGGVSIVSVLGAFLATLAIMPWSVVPTCQAQSPKPPNILVILADDLGYGDVACFNDQSQIPTPNLDRLASQGMRFTDAHSPSTVCTSSRYGVLTGRMCFRTGVRGVLTGVDGPLIERDRPTLASLLQQRGYATACVGKWHLGMTFLNAQGQAVAARGGGLNKVRQVDFSRAIQDGPITLGFDSFFGTACCPTTDWLYAYIQNDRVVQPPSELVKPDGRDWLEYEYFRGGLKAPGFDFRQVDLVFLEKSIEFLQQHVRQRPEQPFFLYHATQSCHLPAMPAERFVGQSSAGPLGDFIVELDFVVGELLATLDRLGVSRNTLVLFSSDNGPEIVATELRERYGHDSARPWRGFKRDNWEGGHRVPLIARWPGNRQLKPGSVCDETVCLTDLLATCAAIVDVEVPRDYGQDSFNLLPLLQGQPRDRPVRPFTLHQTISNALAIRQGPWKLLDHQGSGGNQYDQPRLKPYALQDSAADAPCQLYRLSDDPGERQNLYHEYPDIARQLQQRLHTLAQGGP